MTGVQTCALPISDIEARANDETFVSYLKRGAATPVSTVIDLVFGVIVDEDFESWLYTKHRTTVDSIIRNPRRFVKVVCS